MCTYGWNCVPFQYFRCIFLEHFQSILGAISKATVRWCFPNADGHQLGHTMMQTCPTIASRCPSNQIMCFRFRLIPLKSHMKFPENPTKFLLNSRDISWISLYFPTESPWFPIQYLWFSHELPWNAQLSNGLSLSLAPLWVRTEHLDSHLWASFFPF